MTRTKDDIQQAFDKASERALIESIEREHIERLARIDSREVYREIDEDTFVDSDEWVDREAIWLRWVEAEENKGGIRRKEK